MVGRIIPLDDGQMIEIGTFDILNMRVRGRSWLYGLSFFMQVSLLDYIKSGEYNIKGYLTIKNKDWETVIWDRTAQL